jgi:glycosyltransferase involved in cell wall biosynthesis
MGPFRLTLLSTAAVDRPGSMRRYAELVQEALRTLPEGVRPVVTLVSLASPQPSFPALAGLSSRLANWLHHAVCAARVRGATQRTHPDLVHVLDASHAYVVNALPRRLPVVATVHDLIPLLTARGELPGPQPSVGARCLWRLSLRGMARCRGLLADSDSTRRDLARLSCLDSGRIGVVGNAIGAPEVWRRAPTGEVHCPVPFIFHLGHNAAYKNREGVLRVAALVLRECPIRLVLAGPPPTAALRRLAAELALEAAIDWRCEVSDAELQALYRSAAVFLFPSLYEGFGWPPLEAMACGCPVVCSNTASLPEVVGAAALLAGPADHAAMARHCLDLLTQPAVLAEWVRRGHENTKRFTQERFATELLDAYRRARKSR